MLYPFSFAPGTNGNYGPAIKASTARRSSARSLLSRCPPPGPARGPRAWVCEMDEEQAGRAWVWGLTTRLLGLVYVIAVGGLYPQILGIAGSRGLSPVRLVLQRAKEGNPPPSPCAAACSPQRHRCRISLASAGGCCISRPPTSSSRRRMACCGRPVCSAPPPGLRWWSAGRGWPSRRLGWPG